MAGIGMFNLGGNIQHTSQNEHSFIDQESQNYLRRQREAAMAAGNAGPGPLLGGASDYNSFMMQGGQLGFGAMTGNPYAAQQFMNPYQQQVIDANNAQWQKTNLQTQNQVNNAATQANAFGGSRHGVMAGVAQANNNQAQMTQNAGLLSQGFNGAMDRAGQAAQMGFAGAGANAGLGMQGVGNPDLWRMRMMQMGYGGNFGTDMNGGQNTFGGSLGIGK